jgi:hypothetical protein
MINKSYKERFTRETVKSTGPQFNHIKASNGQHKIVAKKDTQLIRKERIPFKLKRIIPKNKLKLGRTEFFQINMQKREPCMKPQCLGIWDFTFKY